MIIIIIIIIIIILVFRLFKLCALVYFLFQLIFTVRLDLKPCLQQFWEIPCYLVSPNTSNSSTTYNSYPLK